MLVQMSDVDTLRRQLRLPRANANTKSIGAPASLFSSFLSATSRKDNRRARLSRWFYATNASRKSCGNESRTKEGCMKQRAEEGLLKGPTRAPKRLALLNQIPRTPTKSMRGTIGESTLHDHDHLVGRNLSQTRDDGAVLDFSCLRDGANRTRIIILDNYTSQVEIPA